MKKTFILTLIFFAFMGCFAQEFDVKSFRLYENDLTAITYGTEVKDQNGQTCALIKVETSETGFTFDFGLMAPMKVEQHVGEIWVYVPFGVKRVTISHQKLGVLRDWPFPMSIQKGKTYLMQLTTAKIETIVKEQVRQQYLAFRVSPPNATLEVNGDIWELDADGNAQDYVPFGTYNYRVEAPNYHSSVGRIEVNDPDNTQIETITLRPHFGWIEVAGTGDLQGASVYIDNVNVGKAPLKSDALKSGQHAVRIVKKMYESFSQTVTVNDNETTRLAPTLKADFAEVTLKVDADAEIWVNNEKKGTRSWTGPLGSGTYKIECKQANHESSVTSKEITSAMAGQTITLPAPTPIYGSLMVESTPKFCKLYVDGKDLGTTPKSINEILIGQHEIRLTQDGYAEYRETVTIAKGERKQVKATLQTQVISQSQKTTVREDNSSMSSSEVTVSNGIGRDLVFTVNGISFTMKYVDGGSFQMGSNTGYDHDYEKPIPVHSVTLSSFYMGETEVTQALWKTVMGYEPAYPGWQNEKGKGDDYPAYGITWKACQVFISKLNQITGKEFRLPTEAEWEYAARGGKKSKNYKYSGSNNLGNAGWFYYNSNNKTHVVKAKIPNEVGLYDMSGNVFEWCQDWKGNYGTESQINPTGPSEGSNRILRGGSWDSFSDLCRVSKRFGSSSGNYDDSYGFRLCLSQSDNGFIKGTSQSTIPTSSSITANGALPGVFSVSPNQKVHFAKGNLQYQASTSTWRFAENQWDYIGEENKNISPTYSGWIDLFGWGTGNNPTKSSKNNSDYSNFSDWGSKMGNGWRTLTKEEWVYVFNLRSTSSGIRYAKATVNGVIGVILLPDNWSSSTYLLSDANVSDAMFSSNTISSSTWSSTFAPAGAAFLPAAGLRIGFSVRLGGTYGYYWSASPLGSSCTYYVFFSYDRLDAADISGFDPGRSVRLACPVEN